MAHLPGGCQRVHGGPPQMTALVRKSPVAPMASGAVVNSLDQRIRRSSIEENHEMSVMSASVITIPLLSAATGSLCPSLPATLADLAELIRADQSLSPARRREILSALATLARALKRDLQDIPAHVGFIREQLKDFKPSMLKPSIKSSMLKPSISMARWRNVLCYVRAAFKLVG